MPCAFVSRIVGIDARSSAIRFFCIFDARAGSVSIRWSMLASVLNRKCGSTCACMAAMRASTTWRFSASASAISVASTAWASALKRPAAMILMIIETKISANMNWGMWSPRRKPRTTRTCGRPWAMAASICDWASSMASLISSVSAFLGSRIVTPGGAGGPGAGGASTAAGALAAGPEAGGGIGVMCTPSSSMLIW